jgi:LAO/AO transport system kinase
MSGVSLKSDNNRPFLSPTDDQDFKILGRFLTALESDPEKWVADLVKEGHGNRARRIGITGPPGAGKSTLLSGLIREYRQQNLKVGIIAIDPSSPFTHGAILGDRIRYSEHFEDRRVFIRSVGSRGSTGGISGSVYLMLRAFDLWNFDVVLVETVGVGQTELEIMNVADQVCVVVVPEFGDSIQALKAGILEIADVFVVNKADRPGADVMARELEHWAADKKKPVLKTTASEHLGLPQLAVRLREGEAKPEGRRYRAEAAALARLKFEKFLAKRLERVGSEKDIPKFLKTLKF